MTVHVPGHGFVTDGGRFYPEDRVREVVLGICEWWLGLSVDERARWSWVARSAAADLELHDELFGATDQR